MAAINEVAARIMEHYCEHDASHGYSQGSRWGNGTTESIDVDGKRYSFAGGDRDCSSGIISAYQAAGLNVNATYTGNMRAAFLATGKFEWKPMSFTAQRGDIYLNESNHTALCTCASPDLLAEFSIDEHGGISGGLVGDQTGREAYVHAYYDYPFDGILHYIGSGEAHNDYYIAPNKDAKAESVRYTASTDPAGKKWQAFVSDLGGTAGGTGEAIRWLAIDLKGNGWYQVYTEANGWLEAVSKCDTADLEYGCAGDGSPILAVRVYYETPDPSATGYFVAKYHVADLGADYYDWQIDDETWNGQDGYAGEFTENRDPIERFQLYITR